MLNLWQERCWQRLGPVALGTSAGTFKTLLGEQTAVDTAVVGTPAVVEHDGVVIPVAFLNSEIRAHVTTQGHQTTNITMKWLREYVGEMHVPGLPSCAAIELTNINTAQIAGPWIPRIVKVKGQGVQGMDWTWDRQVAIAVMWRSFVANLPQVQLDILLASGRHVCRVTLEPVDRTYDRKRRDMMVKCTGRTPYGSDVPVPVWDYHVLMSDGEVYRFHTDYNKKKASMARVEPGQLHPPPPTKGLNESDGPGSYKLYKICNYLPRLPAENRDDKVWSGGGDGGGGGGGGDDGSLTVAAGDDDGGSAATHGCGEWQDSKEQIGTSSGSDATHGCGAPKMTHLRREQRFNRAEEVLSHDEKLRPLGKNNTVNYAVDQVPVPPASGESTGTQPHVEIRGRCTLTTAVSAVAEPDESAGAEHDWEEWVKTDDGSWHKKSWMRENEGWVRRDEQQGRPSNTWASNTWAESEPQSGNTAACYGGGWSSSMGRWLNK